MAINLDAIKARLSQIQQSASSGGGSKGSDYMWKPPVGKSVIRIVPYAFDKSNPFIELNFHYEIGKRTMVSPTSFGRPDPIVEFAEKLKKTGDKDDWNQRHTRDRNVNGQGIGHPLFHFEIILFL